MANKKENATFYVLIGGSRNLLSKLTVTAVRILKIGIKLNHVDVQEFSKFKNVLVESMKPVVQLYRIPIPLGEKIDNQIKERKIIEEVHEPLRWVSPVVLILRKNEKDALT